jgi:PPOX class probable F420-dependent enzyme
VPRAPRPSQPSRRHHARGAPTGIFGKIVRRSTIPKGARDFLATGPFAHIVTLNPDGTPHVSLAWAGVDDDGGIVWSSFSDQRKFDNLRRDPRVTLSFQAHESGGEPLHPYLVIRGRATIEPGGALDVMDRLAEFYIGPGQKFPMRDVPPGLTVHVAVDEVYGQGPWRRAGDGPEGPDET